MATDQPLQAAKWAEIIQELEKSGDIHEWDAKQVIEQFAFLLPRKTWFQIDDVTHTLDELGMDKSVALPLVNELLKTKILLAETYGLAENAPNVFIRGGGYRAGVNYIQFFMMERKAWEEYKKLLETVTAESQPPQQILPIAGAPQQNLNEPVLASPQPSNKDIFVVHGHDNEMKEATARTLATLELNPIILHEQESRGRTIIEKLIEESSSAGFAVVLLSGDDKGYPKDMRATKARPRARQNVVLELGIFVGKLTRAKVCVLHRPVKDFDFPSDTLGIAYVPYDENGAWKLILARELNAAGCRVDANKLT